MPDTEHEQGQKSESLTTVLIALAANTLIAIAKSVVAVITGSASMVAEAAHSWADAGNEIFLLDRRAPGGPAARRDAPLRVRARGLRLVDVRGLRPLRRRRRRVGVARRLGARARGAGDVVHWAYAVLAIAFVLESVSFVQATRQTRAEARSRGLRPLKFIANTSDPTLRAVFAEDAAALVGLLIAGTGIFLHQVTGNAIWDAIGSILVGLLLGVVAIFLIGRNRDYLVGQAVRPELWRQAFDDLSGSEEVERVTFLHLEFVGPGRVFLVAAVDLTGDDTEAKVATRLAALGHRIEEHELVELAMITLSKTDAPTLVP